MASPSPTSGAAAPASTPPALRGAQLGRGHMLLAYVSAAFGFGSNAMVSLLVPLRAHELGAPIELIGVIVGVGSLIPGFLSVTSGALADRFGARWTYVGSVVVCGLTSVLYAVTDSYWAMLALQVVNGLARNTAWVAAQTYITGVGTPAQRAGITGRFAFSANVGPFVGPIIVGQAANIGGYGAGFLAMAAVCLFFTVIGLSLKEIDRGGHHRAGGQPAMSSGFGEAWSLMRLRGIQVMLILTVCRLWTASAWQAFFPLYLSGHGFSPDLIGIVVAVNGLASSATSLAAGPLTRWASDVKVTSIALVAAALGVLVAPYATSLPWAFLPPLLLGGSAGVTLPLLMTMVGNASPPGRRGVGLGLRSGANSISGGVAPVVTGVMVAPLGLGSSLAASGVLGFGMIAAALVLHRQEPRARTPEPAT